MRNRGIATLTAGQRRQAEIASGTFRIATPLSVSESELDSGLEILATALAENAA